MSRTGLATGSLLLLLGLSAARAFGAEPPSPPLPPEALDQAVTEVLNRPEFAWRLDRLPRLPEIDAPTGLEKFFRGIADGMETAWDWLWETKRRIDRWMRRMLDGWPRRGSGSGEGVSTTTAWLVAAIALALVASVLAVFWRRSRRTQPTSTEVDALEDLADLAEDESEADRVAAEDWRLWAGDLAARGDLRAAVRALYLASLSALARQGFLSLQRSKCNHEYRLEVRRRGRSRPELSDLFVANVAVFERVWYGRDVATREHLELLTANVERLEEAA